MIKGEKDRVLSVNDIAKICHVSNETIRRWIKKHGLKAYNTTMGLSLKILESDFRTFAKESNIYTDWSYLDGKEG